MAACAEIVGDVTPPFRFHEIDRAEMASGAGSGGGAPEPDPGRGGGPARLEFVGGVAAAFAAGHGYCGRAPITPRGPARRPRPGLWRRSWRGPAGGIGHAASLEAATSWPRRECRGGAPPPQSVVLQGPDDAWETTGTLHPNELGHLAMARAFLALLRALVRSRRRNGTVPPRWVVGSGSPTA